MATNNPVLKKVYTAENHEKLMDAYKDWASDYDADTVTGLGYVAHIVTARALAKHMRNFSTRILDAGCGTGLVGEKLYSMGYINLDALDYSKEMLEESRTKGVYKNFIQADLSKPLQVEDDAYGAIVCAGTFTYGHVDASAFREMCRIVRPKGIICFSIREGAYQEYGYRDEMLQLEEEHIWELVEMREEKYLEKEGVSCKMCTYRIL